MSNNEFQTVSALLRRAELFLEDKEWQLASDYYEKTLDLEPENVKAYVGLLLVSLQISVEEELVSVNQVFTNNKFYQKALRFAEEDYKVVLEQYALENAYHRATTQMKKARSSEEFLRAKMLFQGIVDYRDSKEMMEICGQRSQKLRQQEIYAEATRLMKNGNIEDYQRAISLFQTSDYEDACEKAEQCKSHIESVQREEVNNQRKKKIKIGVTIGVLIGLIIVIFASINASNKKRAAEIYNNFLGQSFTGSTEDDSGFYDAYTSGALNPYMTYWRNTEENILEFNEDGTVYYKSITEMTALAYPRGTSEPEGMYNEYDGTYDSFSVSVSLGGTVYVKVGYHILEVSVDSGNVPQSIYDYKGMNLY